MLEDMSPICYGFSLFAVGFLIYYLREAVKPPELICADGPFRKFIEENVHIAKKKFWPTFWCFESRAQTIFAHVLRALFLPKVHYRREILTLKDGGELAIDWADQNCSATSPLVIVLPGVAGESQAEYVRILVMAARSCGIRCVVFHNRGFGGVKLKTPRFYCATNFEDFTEFLDHVRHLNQNIPIGAVGISMGAGILINYLADQGTDASKKLKAGFAISAPWNLDVACDHFERPFLNRWLNQIIANSLRQVVADAKHLFLEEINVETVLQSTTMRDFDDKFTSKLFGYRDVNHYYGVATLHRKLHLVELPLLCLSAADDPMQPIIGIPMKEASKSKNIALLVTARGGHIGFLDGIWPVTPNTYIAHLFTQFFTSVFQKMDKDMIS